MKLESRWGSAGAPDLRRILSDQLLLKGAGPILALIPGAGQCPRRRGRPAEAARSGS